jgi:hypothetical protein
MAASTAGDLLATCSWVCCGHSAAYTSAPFIQVSSAVASTVHLQLCAIQQQTQVVECL